MGSPLSPALRARLARGAAAAHRFHRWAHHPLCAAYAPEVLRFGRHRWCRGCVFLGLGALGGASLGALVALPWVASAVAAVALVVTATRLRLPKWLSRAVPGGLVAGAAVQGWPGLVCAGAAVGAGWLSWRIRGPDRGACGGCPQRALAVCDGLAVAVRRERALQRWAGWATSKALQARRAPWIVSPGRLD